MQRFHIEEIVKKALLEDMNNGDITTDNLIDEESISEAEIVVKEDGVIAGLEVVETAFKFLDDNIEIQRLVNDGDEANKGTVIVKLKGKTRAILSAERTALNLIQRMSGIATQTSLYTKRIEKYDVKLVDTRKTTPGLRALEKYAVRMGGGYNHRFNLSDAVMIKDNHIKAAGGIKEAISTLREKIGHTVKVEVEVETLTELKEAIEAKADIVMLDNMSIEDMKKAVEINEGRVILEASGNITLDNIEEVAKTGVDVISSGALTHSVKALDISLKLRD
ncbi:carboxylating nicotinate-nucleotide diphosphorylase [Caldisalinibacter kiritimatiensis]|uniref:Probable nicotinate-nucleotide pyrophosphorylase [carboxylating] n=1 Tax=Caldisalinibacter kiritimatiensis TaxID=1304284 RepID=R1AU60_9FIRM|nr:carboxylating nicotinate-nucleotide diphosphorylase [Caldisalinibacter kiritimatiensis]EOD00212.1 Quinolinate phosphoribosyltransferase [Caldisalinibacter kiritimatiensis]